MTWTSVVSVILLFVVSTVLCDLNQESAVNVINNNLQQLNVTLPTEEEALRLFRDKCLKNANQAAYDNALRAKDEVKTCVTSLVNVTGLQREIEEAKPTGDLDIVFNKYCRRSPQILNCLSTFTTATEPCLTTQEKESRPILQNITDTLVKFICFKEGDRIALFIAEGGPDCLNDHIDDVQECVNQTLSKYISGTGPTVSLGTKECKDLRALQTCVIRKLENCAEPTPSNMVDALLNVVYRSTPCYRPRPGATPPTISREYFVMLESFITSAVSSGALSGSHE